MFFTNFSSKGVIRICLSECRSGSRGVSRGSRGYFGSPGGYGYDNLKGLEKERDSSIRFQIFMEKCRDMAISDFGFRSTFGDMQK